MHLLFPLFLLVDMFLLLWVNIFKFFNDFWNKFCHYLMYGGYVVNQKVCFMFYFLCLLFMCAFKCIYDIFSCNIFVYSIIFINVFLYFKLSILRFMAPYIMIRRSHFFNSDGFLHFYCLFFSFLDRIWGGWLELFCCV